MYYLTGSVPEYDCIAVRGAPTLDGLAHARERTVWRRPATGRMAGHIWAPELHRIDGRWYIYFAAGDSGNVFRVNEGAAVIICNGRMFLPYSASTTDARYCMRLLTADARSDLLDPAAWSKSPEPVFVTNAGTQQYGPGHNSFTVAERTVRRTSSSSTRATTGTSTVTRCTTPTATPACSVCTGTPPAHRTSECRWARVGP